MPPKDINGYCYKYKEETDEDYEPDYVDGYILIVDSEYMYKRWLVNQYIEVIPYYNSIKLNSDLLIQERYYKSKSRLISKEEFMEKYNEVLANIQKNLRSIVKLDS